MTWYNAPDVVELYNTRTTLRRAEAYVFEKYLPACTDLLDIGCGTGRTTIHLRRMGHHVIGVDYAWPMVVAAQRSFPYIPWAVMDGSQIAARDVSFDAVLFSFNGLDSIYP